MRSAIISRPSARRSIFPSMPISRAALPSSRTRSRANVARAVKTGVAGLSIEDFTGDKEKPLFDRTLAVERIKAARKAIDADNSGVLLTGRCEGFLWGVTDLALVIDRLQAYAEAGADCLYAPGIKTREEIAAVVKAVASEAGQSPDRRVRPVAEAGRGPRRAPDQRRRLARAYGLGRLHEGGEGDGGAGDLHRARQRLSRRRTEQDVQLIKRGQVASQNAAGREPAALRNRRSQSLLAAVE